MSRKTTRPPVKVSGWFFYVDLLTKHKNECKQRQKEQTKGHYILKIKMIFHSITPILKNRGQPTLQHGYPSLYYNPHAEHKQSVILHKKNRKKDSTLLFTGHCTGRRFHAGSMKIPRQPARYGAECSISVHREACYWTRSEQ